MAIVLDVRGDDESVKDTRRALAVRVLDTFDGKLPDLRLLVVLDDLDAVGLKEGPENRGSFRPISKQYYLGTLWPRYIAEAIRTINPGASEATYHFDGVIYLHNSTCEQEASPTMTLAHELQHFVQYGSDRTTWAWNTVALNLTTAVLRDQLGLWWHDFPTEYEARIVAKSVSEQLLGRERTDEYIRHRRNQSQRDQDIVDWEFIRDVDASQPYNCATATRTFFRNRLGGVRDQLTQSLEKARAMDDFKSLNLDDVLGRE
jgi:hypothetical protein